MIIVFWLTTPLQKLMQKINLFQHWLKSKIVQTIPDHKAWQIHESARAGDGLLSNESFHLTNWFIPGDLDHAAVVHYPKDGEGVVIEVVGSGVKCVPLLQWLKDKRRVVLVRRKNTTDAFRYSCGVWAFAQIGKLSYDTLFRRLRKNSKKKVTYCARFLCDALNVRYRGVIEPNELLQESELMTVLDTETM